MIVIVASDQVQVNDAKKTHVIAKTHGEQMHPPPNTIHVGLSNTIHVGLRESCANCKEAFTTYEADEYATSEDAAVTKVVDHWEESDPWKKSEEK